MIKKLTAVTVLFCFSSGLSAEVKSLQKAFNMIAENCKGAVVNIKTITHQYYNVVTPEFFLYGYGGGQVYSKPIEGMGSGVIISPEGNIITNAHVINEADKIEVTVYTGDREEKTYAAKLVWSDKIMDIAMVKITDPDKALPYLSFADSSKLKAGDWAIAIGYPFGLKQTMTAGIVSSAKQEVVIQGRHYRDLIQTDTAINQGNSGGPLLNINGEIVGINTAIYSPSGSFAGIGFAINAVTVQELIENYSEGAAQKQRPMLGISLSPLTPQIIYSWRLPVKNGVIVAAVIEGSPAAKAGLKRGDIITEINGEKVMMPIDISSPVRKSAAGTEFAFKVFSDGQEKTVKIKPELSQPSQSNAPQSGDIQNYLWNNITFTQKRDGIYVSKIEQQSPFAAYLEFNDKIENINSGKISSLDDLKTALKSLNLKQSCRLDVRRAGTTVKIHIEPVYAQ